jgi:hypothetical protein
MNLNKARNLSCFLLKVKILPAPLAGQNDKKLKLETKNSELETRNSVIFAF